MLLTKITNRAKLEIVFKDLFNQLIETNKKIKQNLFI